MSRATPTVVARKQYTCDYCERRIEKGERHEAVTLFPSQAEVDAPRTHRSHLLCSAFWYERLWGDYQGEPIWDWDEAKREYGWDEWLAQRPTETHGGES